jgi:polyhydroxybutyrate depolymerase
MMIHGAGGNAELAARETGWSRLGDAEGFATVFPEGVAVRPDKKAKFLTNPQEWHDGSGRGKHNDVAFLDAVLDRLPNSIDRTRVYLTGFSNGAGMTFRYAAERPNRIAAIAPVAGHCWIEPNPIGAMPTFYIVGDSDPLVPLAGGMVRTPWKTSEVRPAIAETLKRWSNAISAESNQPGFRFVVIEHHGHHWPGGTPILGLPHGGPATRDLDATKEIWRFFADVPRVSNRSET